MDETTTTAPAEEEPKKTNKERLQEITDSIEAGIKDLFSSEKYMNYLRTMSKFHNYSFNNTMLIHMQMPEATRVASFNKWKDKFHRNVKRGEHGIKIIAPTPYVKKIEEMKRDPETNAPILDKNGEVIMEEKQVKIPRFKVVTVFDVSQTYGEPLPQLASTLTGDVQQFDIFMEALKRSAPVPLEMQPLASNLDGYFSPTEQKIAIREGMSEVQTVCAAIHEIAHSKLHNKQSISEEKYNSVEVFGKPALFTEDRIDRDTLPDGLHAYDTRNENGFGDPVSVEDHVDVDFAGTLIVGEPITLPESGVLSLVDNEEDFYGNGGTLSVKDFWEQVCPDKAHKSQRTQEVEAESIAYAVSAYYGIETGENSFGYIASWSSGQDLKELKASLETINRTAGGLINDIDRNFDIICKERGIDRAPKQAEPRANEALFLLDDSIYLHVQRRAEDHNYNFALYTADTLKRIDSGTTALPEDSTLIGAPLRTFAEEFMAVYGITYTAMELTDLNKLHEIRDANEVVTSVEIMPEPEPVLEPPKLDEYPMPDTSVDPHLLETVHYMDDDLLPLTRDKALQLIEDGFTVYSISDSDSSMCMDADEIHDLPNDTVFGVLREEWEASPAFQKAIEDRQSHQQEREAAFLAHPDSFAIYQMDHSLDSIPLRFSSYDELAARDMTPTRDMYDLIYTAELGNKSLDDNFEEFNMARPADYRSYSLSASDIVALNQGGAVSYHYVDRFGFKDLPDFAADNPLKAAEMTVEDDYNMVDGIINNGPKQPTVAELEERAKHEPISLMDLADAIQREKKSETAKDEVKPKRMSIYEQLRQPVPQQPSAPKPMKKREPEL